MLSRLGELGGLFHLAVDGIECRSHAQRFEPQPNEIAHSTDEPQACVIDSRDGRVYWCGPVHLACA